MKLLAPTSVMSALALTKKTLELALSVATTNIYEDCVDYDDVGVISGRFCSLCSNKRKVYKNTLFQLVKGSRCQLIQWCALKSIVLQ